MEVFFGESDFSLSGVDPVLSYDIVFCGVSDSLLTL
jgi:hypothetical protein